MKEELGEGLAEKVGKGSAKVGKGWQRVGTRLAQGWRRAGKRLVKGFLAPSNFAILEKPV